MPTGLLPASYRPPIRHPLPSAISSGENALKSGVGLPEITGALEGLDGLLWQAQLTPAQVHAHAHAHAYAHAYAHACREYAQ